MDVLEPFIIQSAEFRVGFGEPECAQYYLLIISLDGSFLETRPCLFNSFARIPR